MEAEKDIPAKAHIPEDDIERELIQASDKLKAELRKKGVLKGNTNVLFEPKTQHDPRFLDTNDVENWLLYAHRHAMDKITETQGSIFEEIKVENILQDVKTSRGIKKKCEKVLFLGPAGMGKTTVLNRLAFSKLLKKKIVIMTDFRSFNTSEKVLPSHALLSKMFSNRDRMKQMYQWITKNSNKVAVIVDSLDTMPFDFAEGRQPIHDDKPATIDVIAHSLFSGNLLPTPIMISSSREYKVRSIHKSVWPDRCVIIDGLKDESVKALLEGFLGKERAAEVIQHIENQCPDIWPLLKIPVFTQFSAITFATQSGGFEPNTMSGILIKYFKSLKESQHVHDAKIFHVLRKLMPMCFEAMKRASVQFTPKDLQKFEVAVAEVTEIGSQVPGSHGLSILSSKLMHNDRCYLYFNHQTLQECLAALHALSMKKTKFKDGALNEVDEENFTVVCRLIWGILFNHKVLEAASEIVEIPDVEEKRSILLAGLRSDLERALQKGGGKRKVLELFIRLNEAKENVSELIRSCVWKIDFYGHPLNPSDVQAIAFVMKQCQHLDRVNLARTNMNEEKIDILTRTLMDSTLKIDDLNLFGNPISKRMPSIMKLAKHCDIKSLDIGCAKLQAEHLRPILEKNTGDQFQKLWVIGNKELQAPGWNVVGKLMDDNALELNAPYCNLDAVQVQELNNGLGSKKVDVLDLRGDTPHPTYTRALLGLLPHVNQKLDLTYWKINAGEERELQHKLNEIGSPDLRVILRKSFREKEKELRASVVENKEDVAIGEETTTVEPVIEVGPGYKSEDESKTPTEARLDAETTGSGGESASIKPVQVEQRPNEPEDELKTPVGTEADGKRHISATPIPDTVGGGDLAAHHTNTDVQIKGFATTEKFLLQKPGGKIGLAGCSVNFPPNTLRDDGRVKIKVESRGVTDKLGNGIIISPKLGCNLSPNALIPGSEVDVEILAYCFANKPVKIAVMSREENSDVWFEEKQLMLGSDRKVKFKTSHFTDFLVVLLEAIGLGSYVRFPVEPYLFYNESSGNFKCYACIDDKVAKMEIKEECKELGYKSTLGKSEVVLAKKWGNEQMFMELECVDPETATFRPHNRYEFASKELLRLEVVARDFRLQNVPTEFRKEDIEVHLTFDKVLPGGEVTKRLAIVRRPKYPVEHPGDGGISRSCSATSPAVSDPMEGTSRVASEKINTEEQKRPQTINFEVTNVTMAQTYVAEGGRVESSTTGGTNVIAKIEQESASYAAVAEAVKKIADIGSKLTDAQKAENKGPTKSSDQQSEK